MTEQPSSDAVEDAPSAYPPVAPFVTSHEDAERAVALLPPWATSWATQRGEQYPDADGGAS